MKIMFKRGDTTFEIERKPMSQERFKIVCAVLLAVLYTAVVIVTLVLCGVEGVFVLLPVTAAFGLAVCWVLGVSL